MIKMKNWEGCMKRQIWYIIWLLLLIAAAIQIYPYAIKAFVPPSLTVYVINPENNDPILDGKVYLYSIDKVNHGMWPIEYRQLRDNGQVTFKKIPPTHVGVSFQQGNGKKVSIDGIFIHKHDGNVKYYLYYNEHNLNNSYDENSASMTPPAPADTTLSNSEPPSAPTREQAAAINENEKQDYEQIYAVLYDDIRLRDKPALEGKVLTTLKTNDEVTYAGEESTNRSLITIKGVPQLSRWIKVKTNKGIIGWVIKNALQEYNNDENWD
jgi:hypothetical protein